jgi:hypothetical protein
VASGSTTGLLLAGAVGYINWPMMRHMGMIAPISEISD